MKPKSVLYACLLVVALQTQETFSFQNVVPLKFLKSSPSAFLAASATTRQIAPSSFQAKSQRFPLFASTTDDESSGEVKLDTDAILKYAGALAIQMGLFVALFKGLDMAVAASGIQVPFAANCAFFYFFSLKSRVLNPLKNSRPNVSTKEIKDAEQRKMPSWTPPGFIFPIVWLLLIGPLRAATTALIYSVNGGVYASAAILSLMLHLSIGDIWNTINNVERRYGTSVLGICFVYVSAAFAAFQYYQVMPLAGQLLALKLIWLTIASSLIVATWTLNPNPKTGKKYSILPMTGEGSKTEFFWF